MRRLPKREGYVQSATEANLRIHHFGVRVNSVDVAYLYIRKNACSSWKRLLVENSPYKDRRSEYRSDVAFLQKFHSISRTQKLAGYPNRIVVVRDPIERCVSGFLNQIVMRKGEGSRPIQHVERRCNEGIGRMTFRQFVESYLLITDEGNLNPHFIPQVSHLAPMRYTHMWHLNELESRAKSLFGCEVGERYFGKRWNSTGKVGRYETPAADLTVDTLYRRFRKERTLPSVDALLDEALSEALNDVYSKDRELVGSIRGRSALGFTTGV